MERVGYKLLVVVSVLVMISGWEGVEGGRKLAMKKKVGEEVDEPENYSGSYSGTLPGPITGTFQSPGYTLDFPSPGLTGTLPSPSLGSGSSTLCGFPGVMCTPPTTPARPAAASLGGGTGSP